MTEREIENMDDKLPARRIYAGYVAPYLVWILFIAALHTVSSLEVYFKLDTTKWLAPVYAFKSLLCALLLFIFKPWRYGRAADTDIKSRVKCPVFAGLAVGIAVAVLWILPEAPWLASRAPGFVNFYHQWLITPLGDYPVYYTPDNYTISYPSLCYSPENAGWILTVTKLLGSAFVISVAEEYFFRGFLYRYIRNNNFLSVPLSKFDRATFWIVVAVFAVEHDRWFMGGVAGVAYGYLAVATGSLRAPIIAHVVTNLLLGIYVIVTGQYGFW